MKIAYEEGRNVVRLRSNVLVHNRTKCDVLLRLLQSNGQIMHEARTHFVPLLANTVLTVSVGIRAGEKYGAPIGCVKDARITVSPADSSYTWSGQTIDLSSPPTAPVLMACPPALLGHPPHSFVARCAVTKLTHELGTALDYRASLHYFNAVRNCSPALPGIRLAAPLVFVNMLCTDIKFRLGRGQHWTEAALRPGEKFLFHQADFTHSVWVSVKLHGYLWSGETALHQVGEEVEHLPLASEGIAPQLSVYFESRTRKQGHRKVVCYAPFWLVNETSLRLQYSHSLHTFEAAHAALSQGAVEADPFAAPLAGASQLHYGVPSKYFLSQDPSDLAL